MARPIFRVHAVQRMFEHRVSVDNVRFALSTGVVIEEHSADQPFFTWWWPTTDPATSSSSSQSMSRTLPCGARIS
jgi:hypothetical protein